MGCTDILGISEIRTGAKMIYIGVGPDPFKQSGKRGLGRGWSSTIQKKMSSWRPTNQIPSLGHGLSCNR